MTGVQTCALPISADSARRALGLAVPDRPPAFYADRETLIALARALPSAEDPMIRIVDQLGRYARTTSEERATTGTAPPATSGQPATTGQEQPPPQTPEIPPDPDRPREMVP